MTNENDTPVEGALSPAKAADALHTFLERKLKEAVKRKKGVQITWEDARNLIGCVEVIKAALQNAQSVDVESIKREEIKWFFGGEKGPINEYDKGRVDGITQTIDRLAASGYLTRPGFVMVPVEPTHAMKVAGRHENTEYGYQCAEATYRAMIKVAQGENQ